jgi:hypothetical protein
MTTRKSRAKQFDTKGVNWAYMHVNQDFTMCAVKLLELALQRRESRSSNDMPANHWSHYVPGAIVLAFTGFEAWLSEMAVHLNVGDEAAREIFVMPVTEKYLAIYERLNPGKTPDVSELRIAVEVRNEIAHYFPRPGREPRHLPEWYALLDSKKLFIKLDLPNVDADFSFTQKLSSYALAYWVFEVLEKCASEMCADPTDVIAKRLAENFRLYRQVCPPADLPEWDKLHSPQPKAADPAT